MELNISQAQQKQKTQECRTNQIDSLKLISWNINGGFSSKITDKCFRNCILTYDIILLTECWLEKNYNEYIEDFDSYYFPRQKSKSIQGGGTVVLVRRKFHKFVTFAFCE